MSNTLDFRTLSLMDALDIAVLIEEESETRYREFADLIGDRYKGDAADFFIEMAGYEALHAANIQSRRKSLFGNKPRVVTENMIWNIEAPDEGKPRPYMSLRQAYKIAIESEQKAFDFFAKALESVSDKQVRILFEELRNEEAEHKRMLIEKLNLVPPGDDPDLTDDDIDEPPQF